MTKYEVRLDKEKNCEKKSIKEAILSARKIAFENQKHLVEIYEIEDGYVPAIPVCVFQGSGERAGYSVLAFDAEKDDWEEVAYYATEREAFDCMAAMLLEDAAGGYYSEMCVGHKGEPLFSGLWTTEDEELHRLDDFRPEEDLEFLAAEALHKESPDAPVPVHVRPLYSDGTSAGRRKAFPSMRAAESALQGMPLVKKMPLPEDGEERIRYAISTPLSMGFVGFWPSTDSAERN